MGADCMGFEQLEGKESGWGGELHSCGFMSFDGMLWYIRLSYHHLLKMYNTLELNFAF